MKARIVEDLVEGFGKVYYAEVQDKNGFWMRIPSPAFNQIADAKENARRWRNPLSVVEVFELDEQCP